MLLDEKNIYIYRGMNEMYEFRVFKKSFMTILLCL